MILLSVSISSCSSQTNEQVASEKAFSVAIAGISNNTQKQNPHWTEGFFSGRWTTNSNFVLNKIKLPAGFKVVYSSRWGDSAVLTVNTSNFGGFDCSITYDFSVKKRLLIVTAGCVG